MIKALIFDFDGLILDTETPEFEVWRDVYREFGQDLSIETWGQIVGGMDASSFRPLPYLQTLTGRDLTPLGLSARAVEQSCARIVAQPPLPGVLATLRGDLFRHLQRLQLLPARRIAGSISISRAWA